MEKDIDVRFENIYRDKETNHDKSEYKMNKHLLDNSTEQTNNFCNSFNKFCRLCCSFFFFA